MYNNPSQRAYAQSQGTIPTNGTIVSDRDPIASDVYYPLGQFWLNQPAKNLWYLDSQSNASSVSNPGGALQSTWQLISVSSVLASLSDTGNTNVVFPSSSSDTPPDNIQIMGGTGIRVVGNPSAHTLTIINTGSGTETLTGNDGVAVGPDMTGTINTVGGTTVYVTGDAVTNTETFDVVSTAHTILVGTGITTASVALAVGTTDTVLLGNTAADPSWGQVPNGALVNDSVTLDSGNNITVTGGGPLVLGGTASFNLTGTTNHAIQLGNSTGSLTSASVLTNGELLIGHTANDPVASTLTASTGIIITNGAGSITISSDDSVIVETITGDTGGAVGPTAGNIDWSGATTTYVTGDPGTSTLITEVVSTANTFLYGTGATTPSTTLGPLTDGQLIIGDTANPPMAATLTAGTGIRITNGAGSITIDATGSGEVSGLIPDTHTPPGTSPVVPTSGNITVEGGATFTTGTQANPIRTNSLAANTMDLQIQLAGSNATSPTANNFGVAQFNSTNFGVSAGFVTSNNFTINTGAGLDGGGSITLGGSLTLTATGSTTFSYTNVNHAASPYAVKLTDQYLSVDCSAGTVQLNFPNAPPTYQYWIIKDRLGDASTNNISVTTVGGSVTIDGETTYTIASNFTSIYVLFNGTSYEVF